MQKTHRNILIAAVVGVAIVGGVVASSNGDLFQGILKGKKQTETSVTVDSKALQQNEGRKDLVDVKKPFKDPGNPKPLADCSRTLIYDNLAPDHDFGDLWNTINTDIGADGRVHCAYQILAFNDGDQNDELASICGGSSLAANPAESEDAPATISCKQLFSRNSILFNLTLKAKDATFSTSYGLDNGKFNGNLREAAITNDYTVYRVPKEWFSNTDEE